MSETSANVVVAVLIIAMILFTVIHLMIVKGRDETIDNYRRDYDKLMDSYNNLVRSEMSFLQQKVNQTIEKKVEDK